MRLANLPPRTWDKIFLILIYIFLKKSNTSYIHFICEDFFKLNHQLSLVYVLETHPNGIFLKIKKNSVLVYFIDAALYKDIWMLLR